MIQDEENTLFNNWDKYLQEKVLEHVAEKSQSGYRRLLLSDRAACRTVAEIYLVVDKIILDNTSYLRNIDSEFKRLLVIALFIVLSVRQGDVQLMNHSFWGIFQRFMLENKIDR